MTLPTSKNLLIELTAWQEKFNKFGTTAFETDASLSKVEAMRSVFWRFCNCLSSMVKLKDRSDFQALGILTRTLFELLVDMKWLDMNDGIETEKYFEFANVDRFKNAKKMKDFVETNPTYEQDFSDYKEAKDFVEKNSTHIAKKVDELWSSDEKKSSNWRGKTLYATVTAIYNENFPEYMYLYVRFYKVSSQQVHGGLAGQAGLEDNDIEQMQVFFLGYAVEISKMMVSILRKRFTD